MASLAYFIAEDEISFYGLHWDLQQYRRSRELGYSGYPLKPYPKPQKEISISQQSAFDKSRGNPNTPVNPNKSQTGIKFNRSTKISSKKDTSKQFSIGLQDLDEAVFYYFNNVIKPILHLTFFLFISK